MSFSPEDLSEFKAEASDILDSAEEKLFALEAGGEFRSAFDSVFRALHNLKGASGMMELYVLQTHVHELETLLMGFKEKDSMQKSQIGFFLRGIDGARAILEGQEIQFSYVLPSEDAQVAVAEVEAVVASETLDEQSASSEHPQAVIDEFVAEVFEVIERVSGKLRSVENKTHSKETVNDLYRDMHSLKGAAYLFGYQAVGDISHAMESSLEPIRDGTHEANRDLLDLLYKAIQILEGEASFIRNKSGTRARAEDVASLVRAFGVVTKQLKPYPSDAEKNPPSIESPNEPKGTAEMSKEPVSPPIALAPKALSPPEAVATENKEGDAGAGSIRVPVSLLDNLMTLVGEMVLVRNQVLQFSNDSEDLNFLNLSKRLNVVTSEIQGEMMKTRMQPIGNILSKYHRVIRDLSQDLHKTISLNLSGVETELDKSLLESIKDPLTHIVRNSCDHGIETPEVRRAAGKPGEGTIQIRAYHEGGQVVIEVSDDGKGLHKEALLKKAIEKGILTQSQASGLSEKEIFSLIFAPGFSTAAVVTNVSGRGVGMDVVRTNIEKIGGTVELGSVAGKGTTTKIKIPLTLAIIPALIVKGSHETFAIPQVKLEELVRVDQGAKESRIEYLHGAPVYRLRGNILPLVDLNQVLGLSQREILPDSIYNIAVLNNDQSFFGLIIDEIQDTADIVVKPLNRLLKSLHVYSGATILGDGSIALILDIQGIAKVAKIGSHKEASRGQKNTKISSDLQEYLLIGLNSPTKHAIVLGYVNRLEEFSRSAIETSGPNRVIRYGKTILPILSVSELLGYGKAPVEKQREVISVVVIQKGDLLYGLEVEEILDTLSSDAEVDSSITRIPGFFGNLNTPEGLVVAVDPYELIRIAFPEQKHQNMQGDSATCIASAGKSRKQLKILLVEDTPFFRKAVAGILQKEGHTIILANDGQEAFEILNQDAHRFDLVISDIEMPKMNGFELAKAIRAHEKLKAIPLLALSSRSDKKYSDLGLEAGFNVYLEKLKPGILIEAISRLSPKEEVAA
jgi:two-component system, chemotaxis family, sensor kinase CheA